MNEDEFISKLNDIKRTFENAKHDLRKEYALSNNKYKIGDVVTDHYHSILIERIEIGQKYVSELSECVYYGIELKKDLKPKKSGIKSHLHQCNIGR